MNTIIEQLASLIIGTVEFVSSNEIKVLLEIDAPKTTALNTGSPTGFPRVNSYVLIPNETGAVVGLISWLGIERSPFPKRAGLKDFGLIDLPFPSRRMSLIPVGTLVLHSIDESENKYLLTRGVSILPSVGDSVLLPTEAQLRSIIELQGSDRRVSIGTAPLANNANVSIDPDKIFGRHLAVLGNTGSGKSCTVAGMIRWSLESAKKKRLELGRSDKVNARFIILDPNGEYTTAFQDMNPRVFRVPHGTIEGERLKVPGWMWNSAEWCACSSAASGAQRPLLLQALRELRSGGAITGEFNSRTLRTFSSYKSIVSLIYAQGPSGYSGFIPRQECGIRLENIADIAEVLSNEQECPDEIKTKLDELKKITKDIVDRRSFTTSAGDKRYNDFSEPEIKSVLDGINDLLDLIPSIENIGAPSEDAPLKFDLKQMADHLELLASGTASGQFIQYLITRIRNMISDQRLGPIIMPEDDISVEQWLNDYIGSDNAENGQVAILDLSLVPADILNIVVAIIGRLVFDAIQRYHKINQKELPTVIVLEEAHSFIKSGDENNEALRRCREIFEKIAREGRKFGLGLVLSSQRPSEISATVLAQCNTFILHRIVNDRDQNLVERLVPDNLGMLLGELPNLPTREAILLGWATPIPMLVDIHELGISERPQSADPNFWSVWIGDEDRRIDWNGIVTDWTT